MKFSEEIENICLADAYMNSETMYAAGFEWNILLEYNMKNLELKRLGSFDGFKKSNRISAIFKYEDSLFCVAKDSYEIAEFNLKQKSFEYFYPANNVGEREFIHSVCRVGDNIWMFRETYKPMIMVFSLKERKYIQHIINLDVVENEKSSFSFESSICTGTKIWRCIPRSSNLLVLDTEKLEIHKIKTNLQASFYTMVYDNGFLYIITLDGREIVQFNTNTYEINTYKTGYEGVEIPFYQIIKNKNYLFLLPCFEKQIFCYEFRNTEVCLVNKINLPEKFKRIHGGEKRSMFLSWKKVGDNLYLLPFAGNGMLCIDLNSLDIAFYPLKISEKDCMIEIMGVRGYFYENEIRLAEYLKMVRYDYKNYSASMRVPLTQFNKTIWKELVAK